MIIDSHTHIFPENIAQKSIETLESLGGQKAVIGGTVNDLICSMRKNGVDKSVVLPVLTKPEQFLKVNQFALEVNKLQEIISFAGIHPYCENINKCLDHIVEMGFKGVKLHPDYQQTDITDDRYIKILHGCKKRGLIVMIHAGVDPASTDHIHCTPKMSYEVIKELTNRDSKPFIVLAHLGGAECLDEVERLLVGLPVFFDTSFVLEKTDRTRFRELIHSHGHKKILFATDSPWRDAKQYIEIIKSLSLSRNESEAIMGKNCAELLSI